jgi:hypothetical protein
MFAPIVDVLIEASLQQLLPMFFWMPLKSLINSYLDCDFGVARAHVCRLFALLCF